jgi:Holin of 3TMs, for gene-transfer release
MIPVLSIVEIGAKLLDKVIPDKDAREKAQAELIKAAQDQDFQLALAQIAVNAEEAKSDSLFKSGWRPFVGWTCSTSFALHFVIFPIINFFIVALGYKEVVISFDMITLTTTLGGLLGIGGLRTYEKIKGVSK